MDNSLTYTQLLFACCLFVFGPAFGFWAAYKNLDTRVGKFASFAFGTFCAYAGWFISGITASYLFPRYPVGGPSETIACLFAVPGFVTGYLSTILLQRIAEEHIDNYQD